MSEESSDKELTRPPDDHDLVFIAEELNKLGAEYIVIGGLAINRLGYVRATDDLDLLISKEKSNQEKVKLALAKLPDQAVKELGDEDLASWIVVRVNDVDNRRFSDRGIGYQFQGSRKRH